MTGSAMVTTRESSEVMRVGSAMATMTQAAGARRGGLCLSDAPGDVEGPEGVQADVLAGVRADGTGGLLSR